jgi:hypothetical protein
LFGIPTADSRLIAARPELHSVPAACELNSHGAKTYSTRWNYVKFEDYLFRIKFSQSHRAIVFLTIAPAAKKIQQFLEGRSRTERIFIRKSSAFHFRPSHERPQLRH